MQIDSIWHNLRVYYPQSVLLPSGYLCPIFKIIHNLLSQPLLHTQLLAFSKHNCLDLGQEKIIIINNIGPMLHNYQISSKNLSINQTFIFSLHEKSTAIYWQEHHIHIIHKLYQGQGDSYQLHQHQLWQHIEWFARIIHWQ